MATDKFESLAGLRNQIIDNCCFFNTTSTKMSLIITHEPIGTFKSIVLFETSRRRDVLLSSDSFDTVTKALEHLFIKSSDAVQQYITANNFRRLPSEIDRDDGGASSVSSYTDETDREGLADSSLSLESEIESAYESLSEDGDGTVSHSGVRPGGRPRSYDIRTVRRDSRSRSRSRSLERTSSYRKAPVPSSRYPLRNVPVHRNRAVDPPRPYAGNAGNEAGNFRFPTIPARFPTMPLQMPPMPEQGLPAHYAYAEEPTDPRSGLNVPASAASVTIQQRLNAIQQQKRAIQEGQRISAGILGPGGKAVSQPSLPPPGAGLPMRCGGPSQSGPWPQLHQGNDTRPYMVPPMRTQRPWSIVDPLRYQSMPHEQLQPAHKSPLRNVHPMGMPTPPPVTSPSSSMSSAASSSVSSTPTVTVSSKSPPEYSPPLASESIDYRLVIKVCSPHTLDAMSETRPGHEQPQEHRIIARTPPTRGDMSAMALRYIRQNPALFPQLKDVVKGNLRGMVTRAVFSAAKGCEDSYDLTAYAEHDLSQLCENMKVAGGKDHKGGQQQQQGLSGWPLFEVVVSNFES